MFSLYWMKTLDSLNMSCLSVAGWCRMGYSLTEVDGESAIKNLPFLSCFFYLPSRLQLTAIVEVRKIIIERCSYSLFYDI